MKTSEFEQGRNILMGVSLFLISFMLLRTMYIFSDSIIPGMSHLYNLYSGNIAPNVITVILFDFRGYDTLGETFILITAVITTTMVFGWGSIKELYKKKESLQMTEKSTVIQRLTSFPMSMLLVAFGVTIVLGGHITPGGGFPGGSVIATGYFLSVVIYGLRKTPFRFTHKFLINLSTIGALIFLLTGVVGLVFSAYYYGSGYYLYNTGVDPYQIINVGAFGWENFLDYPDPTHPGVLPYLNIGVGFNVLAGLSLIAMFFMEAKKDE